MKNFLKKQWFIIGIAVALLLAYLKPEAGIFINPGKISANIAIILLFLISGISLPTEKMIDGIKQYKIHMFVQFFIFIFTPAYFYFTSQLVADYIPENLRVGIFALGVLPTTISSCIVFTQISGGNTAITIFNAVSSNFAGILISPLLLTMLLHGGSNSMAQDEIFRIIMNLGYKVLLPFIVGQILHKKIATFVQEKKSLLSNTSTILILLIIYFAFCGAMLNPTLKEVAPKLPLGIAYIAIAHIVLLGIIFLVISITKFSFEDKIAVMYCAPQKTLALGVPLLSTYFADSPDLLGTALVPILFYHPWQIIIASLFLYPFFKKRTDINI